MPITKDKATIPGSAAGSFPNPAQQIAEAVHALRSPLNGILGWARILAMKHGDDPEIAQIAARIERSGRAQVQIIEELAAVARNMRG